MKNKRNNETSQLWYEQLFECLSMYRDITGIKVNKLNKIILSTTNTIFCYIKTSTFWYLQFIKKWTLQCQVCERMHIKAQTLKTANIALLNRKMSCIGLNNYSHTCRIMFTVCLQSQLCSSSPEQHWGDWTLKNKSSMPTLWPDAVNTFFIFSTNQHGGFHSVTELAPLDSAIVLYNTQRLLIRFQKHVLWTDTVIPTHDNPCSEKKKLLQNRIEVKGQNCCFFSPEYSVCSGQGKEDLLPLSL